MSVALLERTPGGVLVKHLDVRAGKSVEDVADATKAMCVGQSIIEWWSHGDMTQRGGTNWWALIVHSPGDKSQTYDLRRELGRALSAGLRISTLAGALRVSEDHRPVVAFDAKERAEAIGRDLMGWWAAADASRWFRPRFPSGRTITMDLRVQINQAVTGFEVERARLPQAVAAARRPGP